MLECTGAPCIDTLGVLRGSKSLIAIVFLIAGESINATIMCSASASSHMSRDYSGVKVDASLLLFWCP